MKRVKNCNRAVGLLNQVLLQTCPFPLVAHLILVSLLFGLAPFARAAAPSLLDGFAPDADFNVDAIAVQPDGKILLGGAFTKINGTMRNDIARLNPDGSLDTTFNPTMINGGEITSLALQPDGKILVGGDFVLAGDVSPYCIARLNPDGALDTSFKHIAAYYHPTIYSMILQPDGKIVLGGDFRRFDGSPAFHVERLKSDGSNDSTFQIDPVAYSGSALALQPDGKLLLPGANGKVYRLNPDGSIDTSFKSGSGVNDMVLTMAVQADGKVLLGGLFTTIDGVACNYIARLNADGSRDVAFNSARGVDEYVTFLLPQPDGKVLLAGNDVSADGSARSSLLRLNADGSRDSTFDPGPGAIHTVYAMARQSDGNVLLGGSFSSINGTTRQHIARLNTDGSLDVNFAPGSGANTSVNALVPQPDGKLLLAGWFNTIDGAPCNTIARLNRDGSLDPAFNAGSGVNGGVEALALQPDGKVIIGGYFATVNGQPFSCIARLNADGSLDSTFQAGIGSGLDVSALALQPDGKLLIAGEFSLVHGTWRPGIARLNSDGSLDTTFNPTIPGNADVYALALQPDGKVILGGRYFSAGGSQGQQVVRLNANGSLDTTFNSYSSRNDGTFALALQPDGKVILGGAFTLVNGKGAGNIVRLNADGSFDATFISGGGANASIYAIALQANGKVLIGGNFTDFNGTACNHIARLNADGSVDATFNLGSGANGRVNCLALQSDGKVLLGGDFTSINGTLCNYFARLSNPDVAQQSLAAGSDGSVTWMLGGSFPQLGQVFFEHSDDAISWSPLGWGMPVAGLGFRLTGLSLPLATNHYLRVTGWASAGYHNGSAGLYRAVRQIYITPYQCLMIYIAGAHGSLCGGMIQLLFAGDSGWPVTAVPDAGYQFTGWSDGSMANPRIDDNVRGNILVTANFACQSPLTAAKSSWRMYR